MGMGSDVRALTNSLSLSFLVLWSFVRSRWDWFEPKRTRESPTLQTYRVSSLTRTETPHDPWLLLIMLLKRIMKKESCKMWKRASYKVKSTYCRAGSNNTLVLREKLFINLTKRGLKHMSIITLCLWFSVLQAWKQLFGELIYNITTANIFTHS